MNTYAIFVVNDHLQVLFDEAAVRRAHQVDKPSIFDRIASAATSLKAAIDADDGRSILPALNDYPYRG